MKKLLVMCMAMMAMGFAACSEDIESKQSFGESVS